MSDTHADAVGPNYDVVIVGAGVVGAAMARRISDAGKRVLLLEAGTGDALEWDRYEQFVETFRTASRKATSSGYPKNTAAPWPDVLDIPKLPYEIPPGEPVDTGYYVEAGPIPFRSDYLRMVGGTTMHWQGSSFRMLPNDFHTKDTYRQGENWPITYDDLDPYYEDAELEIGVAADVEDQAYLGVTFRPGYVYPMKRMPQSYMDTWLAGAMGNLPVNISGSEYIARGIPLPQGRNSEPNPDYNHRAGYQPVSAVGNRDAGQRCQGNSACMPVCPVQAKYNAAKSVQALLDRANVTLQVKSVASELQFDPGTGRITGLVVKRYTDPADPSPRYTEETVTGTIVVLAGNAIENVRLMLSSGVAAGNANLGANLMDHPYLYISGTAPEAVYPFRGPDTTTGIDSLRDGAFRSEHSAFRASVSNWGWSGSPAADVKALLGQGRWGRQLRDELGDRLTTQVKLGIMLEQLPSPTNRVTVSPRYQDKLDNLRPILGYDIDEYVLAGAEAAVGVAGDIFRAAGITDVTDWKGQAESNSPGYTYKQYKGTWYAIMGSGHIAGTHRMGANAGLGVTDTDCRVFEHDNLYAVGCGSMVSIGTSNPTLTAVAIACKSADAIVKALR